jgi:signal transduction histidine kinase
VQVVKTPLYDADQHVIGIQGAFWDVTDQVRVEETLRAMNATLEQRVTERTHELLEANVRLIELDQLKDEFIGRISHELRTPLANIKLYLELLKRGKFEHHDQYMDTLQQQADRLHRLIDDLLDISHLNPAAIDARHELLDVNALVHEVMADHAGAARERQLTLSLLPSPDLPRLTTDRALLRQVFVHLLANALSYTPRGGAITLHAALDAADRTWVTIEVRDTGPGISANDLPHIFEPFYRGEAAADYRTPGTGVGLAIAQRIIGQIGGHITVDSQPDQGAAFVVWLKATQT